VYPNDHRHFSLPIYHTEKDPSIEESAGKTIKAEGFNAFLRRSIKIPAEMLYNECHSGKNGYNKAHYKLDR
ncbi:hypothetical protein LRN56_14945, partial [Staphylococcus aureus]|uniref:hypothetical protein n=1 Tax=Staphylococcus aureus TaxID=1280 RepID=UPI001E553C38